MDVGTYISKIIIGLRAEAKGDIYQVYIGAVLLNGCTAGFVSLIAGIAGSNPGTNALIVTGHFIAATLTHDPDNIL